MIDLHVLDKLAKHHLQFEINCSKSHRDDTQFDYSSDSGVVCALHRIRHLVMKGHIEDAVPICEALCAGSISDPRLQLDIRIHKFCELIHITETVRARGGAQYANAVHEALQYAQQLASFALNAFPEAYELFTEAMMLFALPHQTASPQAMQKRRERIANQLVSLARFSVCARDSCLSFLMRYLLLIYVNLNTSSFPKDATKDNTVDCLVSELLCSEPNNDAHESLVTWSTDECRPRRLESVGACIQADIQALRERARITRQESLESLAFAHGNLAHAMRNELGRVVIRKERMRRMIVEYCAARGLKQFHLDAGMTQEAYSQTFMPLSEDHGAITLALPAHSISPAGLHMYRSMKHVRELAEQDPGEAVLERICVIESVLGTTCTDSLKFRIAQQKILLHLRKRNFEEAMSIAQSVLGPLAALHSELFPSLIDTMSLLVCTRGGEVTSCGESRRRKPPVVRFDSNESFQVQTESRSNTQEKSSTSMSIERAKPESIPQNAEALSYEEIMRRCNDRVTTDCSFVSMIEEAYVSFQMQHGEPDMVRLLKALLVAHQNWELQLQMCDQLAESFLIPMVLGRGKGKSSRDDRIHPAEEDGNKSQLNPVSGSSGEARARGPESREQTILDLMEFMEMSRAEAIAVLRNYPQAASTQAILDSLLGSLM